jgi:arylsulfatase A
MRTQRENLARAVSPADRSRRAGTLGVVLVAIAVSAVVPPAATDPPPNIILVLVDDQSWSATSVPMDPAIADSRSDFHQTPNLEALAAAGLRFTNAYSAASVCSPTRASIQVGKSPAQLQLTDVMAAAQPLGRFHNGLPLVPPKPVVIGTSHATIPDRLKQANPEYRTALFGKWHLSQVAPEDFGHDASDRRRGDPDEDPRIIFSLTELAGDFMAEQVAADQPFFVQVSHIAAHEPIQARAETISKYEALPPGTRHRNVPYAAMTEDLDTGIGQLRDRVRELGIEENTYIIYTSDNGAFHHISANTPLFRGKSELAEGGIRVPLIVAGPGISPGAISRVPVVTTDLFSTISALAGNTEPLPEGVEGASLVPLFENSGQLPAGMANLSRQYADQGELYFHSPHNFGPGPYYRVRPMSVVIDGDYKLIRRYGENGMPDELLLFNLADNVSESWELNSPLNLADDMPELTAALNAKLDRYLQAVDASLPYDVAAETELQWDAATPGTDPDGWRSTIDVDYKARETWSLDQGDQTPQRVVIHPHQPGLPELAYRFDGIGGMTRKFFHVSDIKPRVNTIDPGVADMDRSASFEFWLRTVTLNREQMLFETGDASGGLSITFGDADGDGVAGEVRLRALGDDGKQIAVTAPIAVSANPIRDFVHLVAVLSDDPTDRYAAIYVNGALAGMTRGATGADETIHWDWYDEAGLGRPAGEGIGGDGGEGDLPLAAQPFAGELASFRFSNRAIDAVTVQHHYNAALENVAFGIAATSAAAEVPIERPNDVGQGALEADNVILVIQERNDTLDDGLRADLLPIGGEIYGAGGAVDPVGGGVPAGMELTSYLLHFDPVGEPSSALAAAGTIRFDEAIQAVLIKATSLAETDTLLGTIGRYATDPRGVDLAGGDSLMFSDDLHTLTLSLHAAGDELVELRVITAQASGLLGDMNLDGGVDFDDVGPFVLALNNPADYLAAFGRRPTARGDFNRDGHVDFDDIPAMVTVLNQLQAQQAERVPEPPSIALVAIGLLGLVVLGRRGQGREP